MSIASQITTMQEHIEDIYDTFAVAGVDTSAAAKNIVNINANLKERLEYYLANGLDVVWNNWEKVSGSGTTLSLNNTIQAKMDFVYKGNTSQSILPSGYTQVDYITSDGNSYIDTGKALGDNFKIETNFIHNQQSSAEQPIISTYVNLYAWFNVYIASDNQLRFYAVGNHVTANPTLTIGNINTLSYSRNSNKWVGTLNGEEVTFDKTTPSSNPTTFKIFARGDNVLGSYVSIYRLKLFKNNILTMDLIPCYRNSDNVIGMYDIVNNIFYTNSGTGNFTYGSVAPNPEYPIPVQVVTGDNTIKVEGKNLFNAFIQAETHGSATYSVASDGKITQSASDSSGWNISQNRVFYLDEGTYTFSVDVVQGATSNIQIRNLTDNTDAILTNRTSGTFTLNGRKALAIKTYGSGGTYPTSYYIQIEKGSTATEYEAYQSASYSISLGVENLINPALFTTTGSYNVASINNGEVISSSITGYAGVRIALGQDINLKTNDEIYVRLKLKSDVAGDVFNTIKLFNSSNAGITSTEAKLSTPTLTTEYQEYIIKYTIGTDETLNKLFIQHKGSSSNVFIIKDIQISYKNGSYTSYGTTPMELCKIGTYQDTIAKSTGKNLCETKTNNTIIANSLPSGTYTFSLKSNIGGGLILRKDNASGTALISQQYISANTRFSITFTISETTNVFINGFSSTTDTSFVDGTSEWQLEKGTQATSYEPYGKVWYIHKDIGKVVLNGSENWIKSGNSGDYFFCGVLTGAYIPFQAKIGTANNSKSNYFIKGSKSSNAEVFDMYNGTDYYTAIALYLSTSRATDVTTFKNWLSTHNTILYYILATPTTTEITDTTLLSQLEAIKLSYNEQTNISQTNTGKPFILDVTALKDLDAEDTTPALATNRGLLFTQPPVSENSINDEDDNSRLEETINEEEPNIEDNNREEEEPGDFFEKEIINNDEEQEEIPPEPIEIDNGQR